MALVQSMYRSFGLLAMTLTVLGIAAPVHAQDAKPVEVSGGYQYLAAKSKGDSDFTKFPAGWYADVAFNVSPVVAIVGNVGGNYKTETEGGSDFKLKVHEFMGGVRVHARKSMIAPFGQVLVGGVNVKGSGSGFSQSENDLGFILGGGVNIMPMGAKAGIRGGVDYVRIKAKSGGDVLGGDDVNGFRFVVGIVFGLGG